MVVETGGHTYLASLAKTVSGSKPRTSFNKGVNGVTMLLLRFMLVMAPLVFMINGIFKKNWVEAFTFALSVAVGLAPEMLPVIVTANLAKGAIAMSDKKAIARNNDERSLILNISLHPDLFRATKKRDNDQGSCY